MVTMTTKTTEPKLIARDVKVFYGAKQALHGISMQIAPRAVTALIGPSG